MQHYSKSIQEKKDLNYQQPVTSNQQNFTLTG